MIEATKCFVESGNVSETCIYCRSSITALCTYEGIVDELKYIIVYVAIPGSALLALTATDNSNTLFSNNGNITDAKIAIAGAGGSVIEVQPKFQQQQQQ